MVFFLLVSDSHETFITTRSKLLAQP